MPAVTELKSGRFRVQWRDATGQRRSAGRSFPTKKMAHKYGLDREAEVRKGEDRDPKAGKVVIKVWIRTWLDNHVAEPSTIAKMDGHLRNYIAKKVGGVTAIGDLQFDQLDEAAIQSWVRRLSNTGLAPATVYNIYTTFAQSVRAGLRKAKLSADMFEEITLPTIPPPDDFYWEPDEVESIRAELTDVQDIALFEVLQNTGVRWGEAVALHLPRWMPLRRRLSVVNVLLEGKEHGPRSLALREYPKGKRRRELPVASERLLNAMAAHLAVNRPIDCGLDHGKRRTCPGLVFHSKGQPLSRWVWPRSVFDKAVASAAPVMRPGADGKMVETPVRRGTVHDLRHTYASWLVLDGVPIRLVQALLGHASIRTTERYSHLDPRTLDDKRLLASLKDKVVKKRESKREATG